MKLKDVLPIIKLGRIRVYGKNSGLYLGHPMPLYTNHEDKYTDILNLDVDHISADCMCEQACIEIHVKEIHNE
jgi:hypothetical protein